MARENEGGVTMNGCIRRAWLVLGTKSIDLEDPDLGYFCSELDLGYPAVREVTSNRPDQDGVDDRTRYMGGRVVSADITALLGARAQLDAVASSFGPYMAPSARPVLHYILDRPGAPERVMTLRGSGYSWPISGPYQRDLQLQWLAADPVAYSATVQSATAMAGSVGGGRQYNLGFNRIYPAGGSGATTARVHSYGDLTARPILTIYGPISGPNVYWGTSPISGVGNVFFRGSYVLNAGAWITIDTRARTITDNSGVPLLGQVDWSRSSWPAIVPDPQQYTFNLFGTNTSGVTQLVVTWQDAYLS